MFAKIHFISTPSEMKPSVGDKRKGEGESSPGLSSKRSLVGGSSDAGVGQGPVAEVERELLRGQEQQRQQQPPWLAGLCVRAVGDGGDSNSDGVVPASGSSTGAQHGSAGGNVAATSNSSSSSSSSSAAAQRGDNNNNNNNNNNNSGSSSNNDNNSNHIRGVPIADADGVLWYHCPQDNCEYRSKEFSKVKRHLANLHDIGVRWRYCDFRSRSSGQLCSFKAKDDNSLKRHKADVHDIGVQWSDCDQCSYRGKRQSYLKVHKAMVHGVGALQVFSCRVGSCDKKFKHRKHLKQHMDSDHSKEEIDASQALVQFDCKDDSCDFRGTSSEDLEEHMSTCPLTKSKVTYLSCDQPLCTYKGRSMYLLKQHKSVVHDIDVVLYKCAQPLCGFTSKSKSTLTRHVNTRHRYASQQASTGVCTLVAAAEREAAINTSGNITSE